MRSNRVRPEGEPTLIGNRWFFPNGAQLPAVRGGDSSVALPTIEEMRAERDRLDTRRQAIITDAEARATEARAAATRANRPADEIEAIRASLNEAEATEVRAIAAEIQQLDERTFELAQEEIRALRAANAVQSLGLEPREGDRVRVRREPMTYMRGKRENSYFRDLCVRTMSQGQDQGANERLQRHREEMNVELPKIEARINDSFTSQFLDDPELRSETSAAMPSRELRDITRTDGTGGEFVPPLWLMEEWISVARAGRPYADRVRQIPLPSGTDSINIPRIATGTSTNVQTADLGVVTEVDITTNSVVAPVRTIAGQQDIALQLLEQSPLMFDEIIFADLTADYNSRLDLQCLNGTGVNGQLLGALNVVGINSVAYTDGTPTVPELYPKGADALNRVATNRKLPAEGWHMHPSRWYWMTSALDANSRPLVVPEAHGPYMAQGVSQDVAAEGPVGTWHGRIVSIDANMPNTLGAGTNEDRIIGARFSDQILFEGALRTRALPEVLSGNLVIRLQVYRYVAFTAERYPTGISVIQGTGLATPVF